VTWGKIGRTLQGKTFKHSSMSQAQQFVKEKIEQKLKKGYKK
jgi:predicted DNA-binding WGR domain protein